MRLKRLVGSLPIKKGAKSMRHTKMKSGANSEKQKKYNIYLSNAQVPPKLDLRVECMQPNLGCFGWDDPTRITTIIYHPNVIN